MAQTVKNPPAVWETWIRSLGWEDLEKGTATATHSSILAWRIPWTEELGGYSPWGHRVGHDRVISLTYTRANAGTWPCKQVLATLTNRKGLANLFLKINYFWLCWVSIAMCRLSLVVASRQLSSCSAQASH